MNIKHFMCLLFFFSFLSCGYDNLITENEKTILIEKENSLIAHEKIRELLLVTKGNYSQLACIFNCSPSSLKRLKDGKTFVTKEAEIEIDKHYNYFVTKGNSLDNFKADCISYKWYNHVKFFMSHWWFWVASILSLIVYRWVSKSNESSSVFILILMLYGFICVINYFGSQPDYYSIPDNFINTMDTVWESKR